MVGPSGTHWPGNAESSLVAMQTSVSYKMGIATRKIHDILYSPSTKKASEKGQRLTNLTVYTLCTSQTLNFKRGTNSFHKCIQLHTAAR